MTLTRLRAWRAQPRVTALGAVAFVAAASTSGWVGDASAASYQANADCGGPPTERVITTSGVDLNSDGRLDTVRICLTRGRIYNDRTPWCGNGRKAEGSFVLAVTLAGRPPVRLALNPVFRTRTMFVFGENWPIEFRDYNHDGRLDFNLGLYASCNGSDYKLFSVSPSGRPEILRLPPEWRDRIFVSAHENSTPAIETTSDGIAFRFYANSVGEWITEQFRWDSASHAFKK
jgi:hypothetical protein